MNEFSTYKKSNTIMIRGSMREILIHNWLTVYGRCFSSLLNYLTQHVVQHKQLFGIWPEETIDKTRFR